MENRNLKLLSFALTWSQSMWTSIIIWLSCSILHFLIYRWIQSYKIGFWNYYWIYRCKENSFVEQTGINTCVLKSMGGCCEVKCEYKKFTWNSIPTQKIRQNSCWKTADCSLTKSSSSYFFLLELFFVQWVMFCSCKCSRYRLRKKVLLSEM